MTHDRVESLRSGFLEGRGNAIAQFFRGHCLSSLAVAANGVHVYSCFSVLPSNLLLVARVIQQ